jgi:3-oxoacyl-[acyl-carrier-protein] synthase-3
MNRPQAIILGTGSCVPERRLTNHDLSKMVETNDQWIVQRTGIRERRVVGPGESTATLAVGAARRAIESAGIDAGEIDLVILGTASPEMAIPATACLVAAELGLRTTPAFDIAAACSGFLYGLDTATAYIQSGRYRTILVIGAETLSRIVDYTDRGSCILFGDGAGAAVVQRSSEPGRGVLHSSIYADGSGAEFLYLNTGSRNPITADSLARKDHLMRIHGREVYKFAVQRFEELIREALQKCELTVEQVSMIVPHQVNQRIIDSAVEKLEFPPEKVYVNIDRFGNTSAASIPIALDEALKTGKLSKGDLIIMVAFGAGLTWANAVVRL